ncbi:c-type cytochrome [Lentibacillus saliphilus]|uniref:c-type cytochrome n=1 Tax=Lentibacillus saliphilus TaxID=2737028 RepID=UPI001C309DD5|nr:cytochrome c [Lentibacillus saliphilus]
MKRNAVIPYAIIATVGILMIIVMSTAGVFQRGNDQQAAEGGEEVSDPEAIFEGNCMSCHGADLSGVGNAPGLTNVGAELSKEEIQNIIIQGTDGGMPGGLVNNEQAQVLAEWLSEKKE